MKIFISILLTVFTVSLANAQFSAELESYKKLIIGKWIKVNDTKETLTISATTITEHYSSGHPDNVFEYYLEYDKKNNRISLFEDVEVEMPFEYYIRIEKNNLYTFLIGGNGKTIVYKRAVETKSSKR